MSDVPTQIVNVQMGGGPQGPSNPGPPGPSGASFAPVAAVATGNVALTGIQNLDGVTGVANQRVFLPYQTNPSQNGIWVQQAGGWTRPTDFPTNTTPAAAVVVVTAGGNIYGRSVWVLLTTGVTIDTTNQTWQIVTVPNIRMSAHLSANQNINNATQTRVNIDTKEYDTGNNFNTGTHQFTCPFSGYYFFSGGIYFTATGDADMVANVEKNGGRILTPIWNARGGQVTRELLCTAGDTLALSVFQISGVTGVLSNAESGAGNYLSIALRALQ